MDNFNEHDDDNKLPTNEELFGENINIPEEISPPKLRKSNRNKIIAGVCGGLAEYLRVSPAFVRLIFVLMILFGGWGIIAYLIAAFLMPPAKESKDLPLEIKRELRKSHNLTIWGSLLILTGVYFIVDSWGLISYLDMFGGLRDILLPVFLVAFGLFYLFKSDDDENETELKPVKKYKRSSYDKILTGVCGGLAEYLQIDSIIIRISFLLVTFMTSGMFILIYLLFIFFTPKDPIYEEQKK